MSNVLDFQVNGVNPSKVGGTGTSVKYFPRPLSINGPGTALPTTPSSTNASGALFVPAGAVYNGQSLYVYANGSFGSDTGDPSGTVQVKLYAVTGSLTSPTYTAIAGTANTTPALQPSSWSIVAEMAVDSASGILQGTYQGLVNNGISNLADTTNITKVLAATITGIDPVNGNNALQRGAMFGLVVGVTFGTSDASNTASLYEFTIES